MGIPKAETKGRSHRCPYTTPHEVITSYRLPDKGCFAFISHCFMSDCKICTFCLTLLMFEMTLFQPLHLSVRAVTIVTSHYSTAAQTIQCEGMERDSWKGALIKFIINTIQHSLVYWTTIGLNFIRYKKKTTFIRCAVCGEIVLHTGDR